MSGHIVSPRLYYAIFAALMILTAVTVAVAFMDLKFMNTVVALTIAVVKATLVVLFFMHVKYESKLVGLAVVASVIWLAFLILITMSDYLTRTSDWHLFG